jgi:hypothetical protein
LLAPDVKVADLPAVARVLWSVGDFASLLQAAHSSAEEILWVAPQPELDGDPFVEFEARVEFYKNPQLVLVAIGEGLPELFRREFLFTVASKIHSDNYAIEDIGQLVMDVAEESGMRGVFLY